jgi:ankyrin repeat protein
MPHAAAKVLSTGADATIADKDGVTPLIAAAFKGSKEIAELLVEAGANGDVDQTGKSAIVYAAGRGSAPTVQLLLTAGVDINRRYGNDLTALMWAAGYSDDAAADDGAATVRLLLAKGAQLDPADNRGRTALMIAAARDHAEIVKLLHVQAPIGNCATRMAKPPPISRPTTP